METFPVLTKEGARSPAFEIETAYFAVSTIAQLVRQVEGVTEVRTVATASTSDDIRVEFSYLGRPYIVWEPYGDSSRFWIGPKDGVEAGGDSTAIEQAFLCYQPPLYRKIIGDVLTLRFFTTSNSRTR